MEHKVGAPGMPAAVTVFNLLLYSPAHDGEHIKCSPVRAELATKLNTVTAAGIPGDNVLGALNRHPLQSGTLNARYNCFGLFFYLIVGLIHGRISC